MLADEPLLSRRQSRRGLVWGDIANVSLKWTASGGWPHLLNLTALKEAFLSRTASEHCSSECDRDGPVSASRTRPVWGSGFRHAGACRVSCWYIHLCNPFAGFILKEGMPSSPFFSNLSYTLSQLVIYVSGGCVHIPSFTIFENRPRVTKGSVGTTSSTEAQK